MARGYLEGRVHFWLLLRRLLVRKRKGMQFEDGLNCKISQLCENNLFLIYSSHRHTATTLTFVWNL